MPVGPVRDVATSTTNGETTGPPKVPRSDANDRGGSRTERTNSPQGLGWLVDSSRALLASEGWAGFAYGSAFRENHPEVKDIKKPLRNPWCNLEFGLLAW